MKRQFVAYIIKMLVTWSAGTEFTSALQDEKSGDGYQDGLNTRSSDSAHAAGPGQRS